MAPLPKTLVEEILQRIAEGEGLKTICDTPGWLDGTRQQFLRRVDEDKELAYKYARARIDGVHANADKILSLADECRIGEKIKRKEIGKVWTCPKCERECKWRKSTWVHADDGSLICAGIEKPDKTVLYETEVVTADMVERTRLQIDARKWYCSKIAPKLYGDRLLIDPGTTDRLSEVMAVLKHARADVEQERAGGELPQSESENGKSDDASD